jgi:hypothetical protein
MIHHRAMREEYADSLLENLQKIAKGVDESLDKQLCRKRTLQEQRDHLQEQLQMLLDKHRLYTKTVLEFQQVYILIKQPFIKLLMENKILIGMPT